MENRDYAELYNTNADFHGYVNRYARKHSEAQAISVNEALKHILVQNVGQQYAAGQEETVCEEKAGYGC